MTNVDKLKEEELVHLQEEVKLEDLILLGDDKKIPIIVEFPKNDGTKINTKAFVKQLTLKELNHVQINQSNIWESNIDILSKALFKSTGDNFTREELLNFPIGVVNAIASKIMELSGVEIDQQNTVNQLKDF